MNAFESPRLIADIGTSVARFSLETAPGRFEQVRRLRCADYEDFPAAMRAYLDTLPTGVQVAHAAVAIANPVDGDAVRMTNYRWAFSIEAARVQLALDTLLVVNDFTALAMSLPRLGEGSMRQVGPGQARERSVIGLLGSGSGLGVSGLVPAGDGWVSLATEGGHVSFAPRDELEIAVLRHAWREFDHVSFERLLSGPGLELMYRALAEHGGAAAPVAAPGAPEITRRALAGEDSVAVQTIDVFCAMLGTASGNLAVTLGATGGIYIGGGIVPRLGEWFDRSRFRRRFEDKGRFSAWLAAIPTRVITDEQATTLGASAILDSQLKALKKAPGSTMLSQIRRASSELSPAELRVADHVLAHPRSVLNQPIAEIARAAQVSQPTVIRFCRSLGCEGLSDFKLRLASSLTGTLPIRHVQVTNDDSTVELGAKVLGNTASALLQARGQLSREMIERSIELLVRAGRVECCAVGQYVPMAQDAQFKLLRLGVPAGASTDPRMQLLAVSVLQPGDVALVISAAGRRPELLDVADRAHERGAQVIAIAASQSPLARKADTLLAVDQVEDPVTQMPMIGRILQLLMVDILTVGLAMRRQPAGGLAPSDGGPSSLQPSDTAMVEPTAEHGGLVHLDWPTGR